MTKMIGKEFKMILVDDHKLFRYGIKLLIENENLGRVIGEADDGQKFLELLETEKPDLVIMDIDMPVMNGIRATEEALKTYPDLNILVLSMHGDQNHFNELIAVGAKGFVLKSAGKQELEDAINNVKRGANHFSSELLYKIILEINKPQRSGRHSANELQFSEREQEVLKHLCNGLSTNEIAEKMFLSTRTIESYRSKLLQRTGIKTSTALIIYAIKNKLVTIA